jgi:hypothetical protein
MELGDLVSIPREVPLKECKENPQNPSLHSRHQLGPIKVVPLDDKMEIEGGLAIYVGQHNLVGRKSHVNNKIQCSQGGKGRKKTNY